MIISLVPASMIDLVWNDIKPHLNRATDTVRGKFVVDDIRKLAESGELALWLVADGKEIVASFTTRVIAYPQGNALAVDWVGGDRMAEWGDDAINILEKYAGEYHCTHIEGYGRKAWGRLGRSRGWYPEYVAYRKDLTNGRR